MYANDYVTIYIFIDIYSIIANLTIAVKQFNRHCITVQLKNR